MVDTIYVPDVGEVAQQGGTVTTDGQGRASAPIATSAANQRVSSQSGDFVAGAITDLATLLALAGASGDANTVASLMGRLTRIRDYLALASTAAKQPALGTGVMTGSAPVTIATDDTVFAELLLDTDNLATIAGAISGARMQVDLSRVLGAALSSTNPVLTQAQISAMCVAGQGFCYSTGKNTLGTTSTLGLQVFNPVTSTKNVLIYRVYQWLNGGNVAAELRMTTAIDTALTTAAVVTNMKGGGSGSGIPTPTTNISFALTGISIPAQSASSSFVGGGISGTLIQSELLTNGMTILLPAGVASGLVLYSLFSAAGPAEFAIYGVEY